MGNVGEQAQRRWTSVALPLVAGVAVLAVAIVGALLTGDGITGVNALVETLSGRSGSALGQVGQLLPLGFAFAAGMVSTVNPCGFAMLPAYLGLYLGTQEQSSERPSARKRWARALVVSGTVALGFVLLFGTTGIAISVASRSVTHVFPWIGLAIGIALVFGGVWLLGGGNLYNRFGETAAEKMGDPRDVGLKGYLLFGLSYGVASLSCTLPIFLVVVGSTLAVSGIATAFGQFFAYALGMGSVIMALTIAMTLAKGALVGSLRKVLPYIQPASAVLLLLAGGYIVYYWLTLGELLKGLA